MKRSHSTITRVAMVMKRTLISLYMLQYILQKDLGSSAKHTDMCSVKKIASIECVDNQLDLIMSHGGHENIEDDCDDVRNKVGGIVCQRHRQHRRQHRQAHSLILCRGATSVSEHL